MSPSVLITLEQITEQVSKNNKPYFSFWVRLNFNGRFLSVAGWKYFPQDRKLSTPSQGKGDGKFVNTAKVDPKLYNDVLTLADQTFGGPVASAETTAAA